MPGWITFNRDFFDKDKIKARFNTKIPWVIRSVLKELVWEAYFEDGDFNGIPMSRGDVCMSVDALCERLSLSARSCRSALSILMSAGIIRTKPTNQPTNRVSFYTIVIYNDIVIPEAKRQTNRQATDKQPTTINRSKEVKKLKEVHQNLSPDGEGQAALPLPFEGGVSPPKKKRSRKPEEPADSLTNPNIFLNRVEADYPKTVLVRGRDAGIIKPILVGRKRGGVADPQAEMWGCWVRFMDGEVDNTFKMQDRAHDVTSFVGQYALLIERAGENGRAVLRKKETAQEKMLKWAEEEDRKEAEREQKGI